VSGGQVKVRSSPDDSRATEKQLSRNWTLVVEKEKKSKNTVHNTLNQTKYFYSQPSK